MEPAREKLNEQITIRLDGGLVTRLDAYVRQRECETGLQLARSVVVRMLIDTPSARTAKPPVTWRTRDRLGARVTVRIDDELVARLGAYARSREGETGVRLSLSACVRGILDAALPPLSSAGAA